MSKDAFEAGILKEERPEGIVGRKNETKKKRKSENWRRTGNRGCFCRIGPLVCGPNSVRKLAGPRRFCDPIPSLSSPKMAT